MSGHKSKKRKTRHDDSTLDTSKPSAVFKPTGGRDHTLSIALPGSIIAKYVKDLKSLGVFCFGRGRMPSHTRTCGADLPPHYSALTHDQKTSLAGQIARACAVFCVDEVVVFDDGQAETRDPEQGGYTAYSDPNFFLYHVLTYLETPPNLRKALFPMHPDLRTAGALPSLDMPHHLRSDEWCQFREGITLGTEHGKGTLVDCGLGQKVTIPDEVEANTRVTVQLPDNGPSNTGGLIAGEAVTPEAPREKAGYYWGYNVRQAASLGSIFTECPFDGGYDVSIGTSERGSPLSSIIDAASATYVEPTWKHLIVVFGGVTGIETALRADDELQAAGVTKAEEVFDCWINLVPGQGSRTIRTEEAIWVGLTGLRKLVEDRSQH